MGISPLTVVPRPGGDSIATVRPPLAAARASRPARRPGPPAASGRGPCPRRRTAPMPVGDVDPDSDRGVRPGVLGRVSHRLQAAEVEDALDVGARGGPRRPRPPPREPGPPRAARSALATPPLAAASGRSLVRAGAGRPSSRRARRRSPRSAARPPRPGGPHEAELHPKRDQPLLGTLLEVALQAAALLLGNRQEARAGLADLTLEPPDSSEMSVAVPAASSSSGSSLSTGS